MAEHEAGGVTSKVRALKSEAPATGAVSARQVDLHRLHSMYTAATSGALQAELTQQLEVEAAHVRFVENMYPGDAAKKQVMLTGKTVPASEDCEMGVHRIFNGASNFDAKTGFALQFQQIAVNVCNDVKQR